MTDFLMQDFQTYLKRHNIPLPTGKRFTRGGLCFLGLKAHADQAAEIAQFTLVRAVRKMPDLRLVRPALRAVGIESTKVELPEVTAIDQEMKVAIFDGGLPKDHPITKWARAIECPRCRQA